MMKLLLIFYPFILFSQTFGKVIGISDGDTITVLLSGNVQKKLRLAEVDCPESGQSFGKNAKQFTSDQIFAKSITFYETDVDRYGRTVARVYYDNNKYLSAEIIKNGFGWWYSKYSDNKELGKLQESAKSKGLGLWQDKNAISPYEWRQKNKVIY